MNLSRQRIGADPTSEEWIAHQTRFVLTLLAQMFPEETGPPNERREVEWIRLRESSAFGRRCG